MSAYVGALVRFELLRRKVGLTLIVPVVQLQRQPPQFRSFAIFVQPSMFKPDALAEEFVLVSGGRIRRCRRANVAAVGPLGHRRALPVRTSNPGTDTPP